MSKADRQESPPKGSPIRWITLSLVVALLGLGLTAGAAVPTATAAPAFEIGDGVEVTANRLNVRAQPGLSGRIVNVLPQGWRAFIDSAPQSRDGFTWYRLWYMGETGGWVAGEYLTLADDGGAFPIGAAVLVATDRLNARAEPGLDGRIINVLPRGWRAFIDSAPQSEDGFTWYRIRYMGETAWVAGEFLELE